MRSLFRALRREWRKSIVLGPADESQAPEFPHIYLVRSEVLPDDCELGDFLWYESAKGMVKGHGSDQYTPVDVNAVAATSTSDGLTTGLVPMGASMVTVTSAGANNIITLPDAPVGSEIQLVNGATGYELRTHSPTTVGINGGTGSAAESAIAANILTRCTRSTSVNWVCNSRTAAGVVGVTEVAAP